MIVITLKELNAKFNFPEAWEELTFTQLLEIIKLKESENMTNFELVRVLLGLDNKTFGELPHDLFVAFETVLLKWLATEVDFQSAVCPSSFRFNGTAYELPADIGKSTIAQYKDAQELFTPLQKEGVKDSEVLALYPLLIATYLQPIVTNSGYDYTKAESLATGVWKCSGLDILNFGNFFLLKLNASRVGMSETAQKMLTPLSKSKLGTKIWRKLAALFSL